MRQVRRSALVAATPQRMFTLINEIERYPEFVPGCAAAQVLSRSPEQIQARLTVGRGLLRTSFTTRNHLTPDREVRMDLVEGPFRSLQGLWTLAPVTKPGMDEVVGCRVTLELDFEPKSGLAGLAMAPLMEQTVNSLVDAFVARARKPD
ncbi:MAG: type II toxin-antitoxin system RatA family toxin [Pseudomonadota bacterium]